MTYGALDSKLQALGFRSGTVGKKARIYTHEATGAKIILPASSLSEAVLPHHLLVVRTVLEEYGIIDPRDPAA